MKAGKKSQDLLAIEKHFAELKTNKHPESSLRSIERILKRHFDLNIDLAIVQNDATQFFGMSIYPKKDIIHKLVDGILNQRSRGQVLDDIWAKNKDWSVEIDSVLLYDPNLNANPAELVAVLLHEMGHVIFSNSIPQRVNRVIRYQLMDVSFTLKKLVQWTKAQHLFDLVFVEACSTKNFRFINLHTERMADKFVVKTGYGENLDEFIGKLLDTQGNDLVNRDEKDIDRDVKSVVNWALDNISELEFRKTKLRSALQTELLQNRSNFIRGIVHEIKKSFFGDSKEHNDYAELVTEQYLLAEHGKVVKESLFSMFEKSGKLKKIKGSDVDILSVEKERIVTEDDKIYVLDLIYDKIDAIMIGLDLIAENKKDRVPQSKETLKGFLEQLQKLRKEVLDLDLQKKQYGLFINYPKGYEG